MVITGYKGYIGKYLSMISTEVIGIDKKDGNDASDIKEDTDLVYHLAAQTSVQDSFKDPLQDLHDNVITTLNVLKHCKKIIFTSSAVVYGNSFYANEIDETNPQSPYAISKLAAEQYIINSGIDYVILRLGNVYGRDNNKGVIKMLKEGGKIHGTGRNSRDYVYIDDVINALIMAKDWPAGIYNIGTGISTSVNQIADLLKIKKEYDDEVVEQKYISLDIIKARRVGWKPKSLTDYYDK